MGRSLFSRPKSRLFRPEQLQRDHAYLEERGSRMIVLARQRASAKEHSVCYK